MSHGPRRIWILLTFRGRPIIQSLVVALCGGDPFLDEIRIQRVVLRIEKRISELPWIFSLTFKLMLYTIEYGIPPVTWKFRRFSRLSPDRQQRYLESWDHSALAPKRILFRLVKTICLCQVLSERKVLVRLGYGEAMKVRSNHPQNHRLLS